MNVGKAIYAMLSADADLTELVGTRIYPEMAPEEAPTPFLVYSILSVEPEDTKQTTALVDVCNLETYAVSENYGDCMDVTEAARGALDRNGGNYAELAIQSIQYVSADTEFNPSQRVYIGQQRYMVRQLRTGSVPDYNVVSPEHISIKDGASLDRPVDAIQVPEGAATVSDGTAVLALTPISYSTQLLTQTIETQYLKTGSSELDLNNATQSSPVLIPFGERVDEYGDTIAENGTTGYFNISAAGLYEVTCCVTFNSEGHGVAPHIYVRTYTAPTTTDHEPEGTGYINGQHGVTHDTACIVTFLHLGANTRLYIYGYDESSTNSELTILAGRITIRRIA